jgi:hypothetical protein
MPIAATDGMHGTLLRLPDAFSRPCSPGRRRNLKLTVKQQIYMFDPQVWRISASLQKFLLVSLLHFTRMRGVTEVQLPSMPSPEARSLCNAMMTALTPRLHVTGHRPTCPVLQDVRLMGYLGSYSHMILEVEASRRASLSALADPQAVTDGEVSTRLYSGEIVEGPLTGERVVLKAYPHHRQASRRGVIG